VGLPAAYLIDETKSNQHQSNQNQNKIKISKDAAFAFSYTLLKELDRKKYQNLIDKP
jgi:cobyrinic acid a,c-diamide synthase